MYNIALHTVLNDCQLSLSCMACFFCLVLLCVLVALLCFPNNVFFCPYFREISAMEKKHKHLIEMLAAIDPAIYLQVFKCKKPK